jgi:UDP-N-acetylmuramyl pentapeptide synthase
VTFVFNIFDVNIKASLPYLSKGVLLDALAALTTAYFFGIKISKDNVPFELMKGQKEVTAEIKYKNGTCTVVENHTNLNINVVADNLTVLKYMQGTKKYVIMGEIDADPDDLFLLDDVIASEYIEALYFVGDSAATYGKTLPPMKIGGLFKNINDALVSLIHVLKPDDVILILIGGKDGDKSFEKAKARLEMKI